ncbi:phosphatase PAP2 family protein [Brumimicrobium glaciale]|uniref:Phosphatase PAP2 family protein n=1 Tax=Brumimicrobium glaciale TaxID=200475 RepID=A0A4Q4KRC8_9FLAO|nr:phosphatase PAP2 family protein [Brumimicrobium glaciale]RYM35823.1 phosphatase PAP2 family protein [Brumimicrobium glaciale]
MGNLLKLDDQLFLFLNNLGTESWDGFWLFITDKYLAFPLYGLLALLVLWKTGFKSAVVSGFMILGTVATAYVISYLMKHGIARPRPCNIFEIGTEMRFPLASKGKECGDFGFVSSHATVGMAMITLIALILKPYYKYIVFPLTVWILLFSYSRIYVGKHYPGDLIVGILIGFIVGWIGFKVRELILNKYKY